MKACLMIKFICIAVKADLQLIMIINIKELTQYSTIKKNNTSWVDDVWG